jgi:beta-lactamase class A
LQRSDLSALAAAGLLTCVPLCGVASTSARSGKGPWRAIEKAAAGRLGVAVLDTRSGRLEGHRLAERFPMCSTFKWLAAACVPARVDAGRERLDHRIAYGRDALITYSPVTERHSGGGMAIAECARPPLR